MYSSGQTRQPEVEENLSRFSRMDLSDATAENRRDSKNWTSTHAGGDTICTEVIAKKDADCPRRAILLNWHSPKKPPDGYNAHILKIERGETKAKSVTIDASQTSYKFEELETDTKYICRVFPIYAGKNGNGTSSNQLQTSRRIVTKIEKMKNFGKPQNTFHRIVKKERGILEVEISWDAVEVGENFKLEKYHIDVYEPGRIYNTYHLQRDHGSENTTSEAIGLKIGKVIHADIVTTYRDLDTFEKKTETNHYSFSTQPSAPKIIDCVYKDQVITLRWVAVDGAQKYNVMIEDSKSNVIKTTTATGRNCEVKFEISDELCFGRRYNFILTADLNKIKSEPTRRTILIGGDSAVTDVVLSKDKAVPRRSVVLNWSPPKNAPKGYRVKIFKVEKNSTILIKRETIEARIQTYKFTELQTNTTYMCKVSPIYRYAIKDESYSDQIKTDKRIITEIEEMKNFGKPKNTVHRIVKKERGIFEVEISWDPVEVGENFKLEKYHIDVYERGWISNTYHLQRDYKPENTTSEAVVLKIGKLFQVDIVTAYKDLDTFEKKTETNHYSFSTQPSAPQIIDCVYKDEVITFRWEAVDGVREYNVVIEDFKTNIVETKSVTDHSCEAKFKVSDNLCFGRTYKFILTADLNKIKSEPVSRTYLIGGNYAVTDVFLIKAVLRRALVVKWDPPKKAPDGYLVEIYQLDGSKRKLLKEKKTEAHVQNYKITDLKIGTKYMCKVSPIYDEVVKDGSYSDQIKTDTKPSTPHIKDCVYKKEMVTFSWQSVDDDAKKYNVTIEDSESKLVETTTICDQNCEANFKISDRLCLGRKYKFTLISVVNDVKSEPVSRTYLIGGDFVCTEVIAKKDVQCPRRAVILMWKSPINPPMCYKVQILEIASDGVTEADHAFLETTVLSHKFEELKTDTTYVCKVFPIYNNGRIEDGTLSDQVRTDKRIDFATEKTENFGQSRNIGHKIVGNKWGDVIVEISWNAVDVGENFKLEKYHINVYNTGLNNTLYLQRDYEPENTTTKAISFETGSEILVELFTAYKDLDTLEIKVEKRQYFFSTQPSTPNIKKCIYKNEVVTLSWEPAHGAKKYRIAVEDLSSNEILNKTVHHENREAKFMISDNFRVGRKYKFTLTAVLNTMKSKQTSRTYLIGGDLVPRNVEAKENAANPHRSIQLTFDAPKIGTPDEYKVLTKPTSKIHREAQLCKNSPVVVEYLRQGIEYSFEVSARHGDKWSEMSSSNFLTTRPRKARTGVKNVYDVGSAHFDYRGAVIKGGTNVTSERGQAFGQARHIKSKIDRSGQNDLLEIRWKIPTFGNTASDYKVQKYHVEIGKINLNSPSSVNIDFVKDQREYCTKGHKLEQGETYVISISTIYIDIDADEEYTSHSTKINVVTRPRQPKVTLNEISDKVLNLHWNHAKGADHYKVSLFTDESEDPLDTFNTKQVTSYKRPFDESFGFGKTYYALIEANGPDGRTNSTKTEKITIEFPSNWIKGKFLGQGACSKVFLALDEKTGKVLGVVKEVPVESGNVKPLKEVKLLRNEVDILQKLSHKCIVRYYGSREDSDMLYLFMEYMSAGSVKDVLMKRGALTEKLTCRYTRQIIDGLSYLHSSKILHRDVKAANILRFGSSNVKLADFGISKELETIFSVTGHSAVGTPYWMSPEVVRGDQYGQRADVWSTGCTVVEMLTTNPPLHQLDAVAAMFRIGSELITVPELPNEVSQACRDFIRIIFVERDQRPTTEEISEHSWLKET